MDAGQRVIAAETDFDSERVILQLELRVTSLEGLQSIVLKRLSLLEDLLRLVVKTTFAQSPVVHDTAASHGHGGMHFDPAPITSSQPVTFL